VIFDATPRGTTPVTVAVYTTGTPRHTLEVSMPGYQTWEQSIDMNPGAGMTIPIQVTLQQVQPTQPPVIGGDQGWYNVYCNVNGAQVMFDTQVVGVITNGVLTVPVYTTGTPYRTYTVTSPGYTTFTGTINAVPAAGQTLDLYATLNPAPTPTKGPFSPLAAVLALAGLALFVAMRRQ
jgi:MYXO-CTERM domain-containing protein